MKKTAIVVLLGLMLALPNIVSAQAQRGDNELLLQGLITSNLVGDTKSTFGTGILGYGRFVTNTTQIGIGPQLSISTTSQAKSPAVRDPRTGAILYAGSPGGTNTNVTVGSSFFVRQYLSRGKSTVYVALDASVSDFSPPEGSSLADSLFLGGGLGFKNYLSEKTALDVVGTYGFNAKTPDNGLIQVKVGITYLF